MVIYVSGPITGRPGYNHMAFLRAHAALTRAGHTVLDPTSLPVDLPEKSFMPICMAMLDQADAIYMLDGWDSSLGATCERLYALRQGKNVYYEGDL